MKLEPRRVAEFLRNPGTCRAVLLYGEDAGLIRERGAALARAVLGAADDPFRLVELDREGIPRIPEEMAALALTGGRRVVRVREAGDAATPAVETALKGKGEALLILEAPDLPARGRLRALLERAADGVAIGCYPDEGTSLRQTIRETLSGLGVAVDAEAAEWLAGQLGADRAATRSELEKLALHAGPGGRVDVAMATACIGDGAGLSVDDALFAATSGDVAGADRALDLALAEGAAPVAVLRAALQHVQRLQRTRAAMANGLSAAEAARTLKPPIFFRRLGAFTAALGAWKPPALQAACAELWEAEAACKRTGAPAETLCRQALLRLARRAAARG